MKLATVVSLPGLVAMTACAASPSPGGGTDRTRSPERAEMSAAEAEFRRRYMSCDTQKGAGWIGRMPDEPTLEALRDATGATAVRIAPPPGAPMSLEGMPGRLTITLDDRGRIATLACE